MGNGTAANANEIGNLIGTMVNKDGENTKRISISNVTYAKNAKFNLFSISSMMKKGWNLRGDKNS